MKVSAIIAITTVVIIAVIAVVLISSGDSQKTDDGKSYDEEGVDRAVDNQFTAMYDYDNTLANRNTVINHSLSFYNETRFRMTITSISESGIIEMGSKEGTYIVKGSIYELSFDDGSTQYIKIDDEHFYMCDINGEELDNNRKIRDGDNKTTVKIVPAIGNSIMGYEDLSYEKNGKEMQSFYNDMYVICEGFQGCKEDVVSSNGISILSTIDTSVYNLSLEELVSVWKVFYQENPAYYWMSNTFYGNENKVTFAIDNQYAKWKDRDAINTEIEQIAYSIAADLSDCPTDLDKYLAIHDYINQKLTYAYESDGITPKKDIWAHNIVGLTKGSGVCECYAKSYQYLCQRYGLECIFVSGYTTEPHAWNQFKCNGRWFSADLTFDDSDNTICYDNFGMGQEKTFESRTEDGQEFGIYYSFIHPKLSERDIELAYLYDGTHYLGAYCNIDDAFLQMTNSEGEYEIRLNHYSNNAPGMFVNPAIDYHIESSSTPNVSKITIMGELLMVNSSFYLTFVYLVDENFQLHSDFAVGDIEMIINTVHIGNKTLFATGTCTEFSKINGGAVIVDDEQGGTIIADTISQANFYANIDVETFNSMNGHNTTHDNFTVDQLSGSIVLVYYAPNMKANIGTVNGGFVNLESGNINNVVTIDHLKDITTVTTTISEIEHYPTIKVGDSEGTLYYYVTTHITFMSVDALTGKTTYEEKYCNISDIEKPLLYYEERNLSKLYVLFNNNYTDLEGSYTFDENSGLIKTTP